MFTNPEAVALILAMLRLSGVPPSPMLPALESKFKVGVLILLKLEFVMSLWETSETDVLPLTVPDRVRDPLVAVSSTV